MKLALPLTSILVLGALGGCSSLGEASDGPFATQGFSDGCRTANARKASFSTEEYRDEALFDAEASYRAGWRQGYQQCSDEPRMDARPGDLGERDDF